MTHDDSPTEPPQRSSAWLCTTHLVLHAVDAGGNAPVPVCLAYSAEDPYAVYLDSHTDTDLPITWVLSREVLTSGTKQQAGAGDVSVYPGHGDDAGSLYIHLTGHDGPEGTALLRARASDVEAFLRWTRHIVPPGHEDEYLDLDPVIRQLLDQDPET